MRNHEHQQRAAAGRKQGPLTEAKKGDTAMRKERQEQQCAWNKADDKRAQASGKSKNIGGRLKLIMPEKKMRKNLPKKKKEARADQARSERVEARGRGERDIADEPEGQRSVNDEGKTTTATKASQDNGHSNRGSPTRPVRAFHGSMTQQTSIFETKKH